MQPMGVQLQGLNCIHHQISKKDGIKAEQILFVLGFVLV